MNDRPSASQLANQHLGLLLASGTTIVVIAKILLEANFDVTTALAIVWAAPTATLLLGLAVALVPTAILLGYGFTLGYVYRILSSKRPATPRSIAGLLGLLGASLFFVSVAILITMLILSGLVMALARLRSRRTGGQPEIRETRFERLILRPLALFALLIAFLSPHPWPAERIEVERHQQIVAFVLEDEGEWWTGLGVNDRVVMQIKASTVRDRTVCKPFLDPDWMYLSLPQLLRESRVPAC